MKIRASLLLAATLLSGCPQQSAENAETEKRVALCKDIMKLYIVEAKTYERDRQKLIASCHMSQRERTVDQWQCVLSAMQKGEKYEAASNQCGKTPVTKP
ncbi:MAG: hypothetical protein FIA97_00670 [Methylococcaceae bacterium]|nr:hypothetical protein [Methylococcaceae bacterium]